MLVQFLHLAAFSRALEVVAEAEVTFVSTNSQAACTLGVTLTPSSLDTGVCDPTIDLDLKTVMALMGVS